MNWKRVPDNIGFILLWNKVSFWAYNERDTYGVKLFVHATVLHNQGWRDRPQYINLIELQQ